jgi:predicted amidohydrolase
MLDAVVNGAGCDEVEMLRVGIVQLDVATNRRERNMRRAEDHVRRAGREGCELVVLPEAFATALNLPKCRELAEPLSGPTVSWLRELAADVGVHLVAGVLERADDDVHTSAVLLGPDGELLDSYRRMTIYDLERYFISGGTCARVVETAIGRIGLVVGYDIQFPEVVRQLFADRVELVICPSILLRPFAESVQQMVRTRAAENCCYVLFCSATGENTLAGLTYMGGSEVVQSPVGIRPYSREFRRQAPVLAQADREETLLVCDLHMSELRRLQAANPLAKDFMRSPLCAALAPAPQEVP